MVKEEFGHPFHGLREKYKIAKTILNIKGA